MELIKVTNVGLKLTDGKVIPLLRAVVNNIGGTVTSVQQGELYRQIYAQATGMTTVTSYATSNASNHIQIANGTYTYGDNTGFKLSFVVSTAGSGNAQQYIQFFQAGQNTRGLFFKGNYVAGARCATGYANYEYGLMVLFTDENYNVVKWANLQSGVNLRSSAALDASSSNNVPIMLNTGNGVFYTTTTQTGTVSLGENIKSYIAWEDDPTQTDPFSGGGTSEPGGGGGSFDDSTDTITIPSYTDTDLLNRSYGYCGFINVYVTNRLELLQLHSYMFSSLISDTLKKMFADPIECILSLTMLPFALTSETPSNMIIGTVDTDIPSHIAEQQYITIDCGYIDLEEYWKSYLDFSPYTKTSIYLPYIGTREIDTDKIMGRRIGVKYVIDIISGSCIAYISAETAYDNESLPAETAPLGVIYQFSGNAAIQVPISSATYGEFYASLISGLVTAGATAASIYTGGMSAPVGIAALSGAALNVANSKPQISASGALPAVTGWLGIQKPYITIERPKQCLPENQNTFTGYPAFVTLTPGDTTGYTEFEVIHLENIPATDAEKDEITNLMKTGVIL